MASARFSNRAKVDLLGIATYTINTWGETQAVRYIGGIEVCCRRLADNPLMGRTCDHIRSGLRRMEQGKHVVFYRKERDGILVSRILHQRVLPGPQRFDDEIQIPSDSDR